MLEFVSNFIYSLIRIATPLIFVSICSTISQQAGLLNMAAEAMMLTASLGGVLFSYHLPKLLRGVDVCAEKDHNPGAGARRKLENATPGCARSTLEWLRATGSSCML